MQNKSYKILCLTILSISSIYIQSSVSQIARALELANAVYEYQFQQEFANNAYVVLRELDGNSNPINKHLNMSINLDGNKQVIELLNNGAQSSTQASRLAGHILNAINSLQTAALNIAVTQSGKQYNLVVTLTNYGNNRTHQYTQAINGLPSDISVTMETTKENMRTISLVPTSVGVSEYNFVLIAPNATSAKSPLSFSTTGTLNPWVLGINYSVQNKNYNIASLSHYAFVSDVVNGTPTSFSGGEGTAASISSDLMTKLSKKKNVSMSVLAFDNNGSYITDLTKVQPAYMGLYLFDSKYNLITDPIVFSADNMINFSSFTTNQLILNTYDSNDVIQKKTVLSYPFLVENVTSPQVSIYQTLTELQNKVTLNVTSLPFDNDFASDEDFAFNFGNYCFITNPWNASESITAIEPGTSEYKNLINKLRTESSVSLVMLGYDKNNNLIKDFSKINKAAGYSLFAYDGQGVIIDGFPVSFSANDYYNTNPAYPNNGFTASAIPSGIFGGSVQNLQYPFLLQINLGLSTTDMTGVPQFDPVSTTFTIQPSTGGNNYATVELYGAMSMPIKQIVRKNKIVYAKTEIQSNNTDMVNVGVVKLYDASGNPLKINQNGKINPVAIYFSWSTANKGVPTYYKDYMDMQTSLGLSGLDYVDGATVTYITDGGTSASYSLDATKGVHIVQALF